VFTLLALQSVPASIVFFFINLTVIVGTTLAGFILWKERLRGMSVAVRIVAARAIVLLSVRWLSGNEAPAGSTSAVDFLDVAP